MFRRRLDQFPKPPPMVLFDAKEQWLFSELPPRSFQPLFCETSFLAIWNSKLVLSVTAHLMATGGGSKCWQTNKSSIVVKLKFFFFCFSRPRESNQLFSNRDFEMLPTASRSAANPLVPLFKNRNHHLHPPFRRHRPRGSMQHCKGVWAKTMPKAFSILVQISSVPDA